MDETVACVECGAPVSASFARRMKGLCVLCRSKRRSTNPFFLLYSSLIQRVQNSPGGFDALSETEKLYYAVNLFMNEISNGGFHQYFFNTSGSYYDCAEKGLAAIDATQTLELLRQAKQIVFPTIPVPVDTETRRNLMLKADTGTVPAELADKLDALDRHFYSDPENLNSRLQAFAREQGLVSGETDAISAKR